MEQETQRRPGEEMQEESGRKARRGKVWDWTGFGDKSGSTTSHSSLLTSLLMVFNCAPFYLPPERRCCRQGPTQRRATYPM